jgi:murein L,D-transpeptidase YafK
MLLLLATLAVASTCPLLQSGAPAGLLLVVDKAEFRLGVYRDGALAFLADQPECYDIALGGAPAGDKEARGDERTPEGVFRITHRNPTSRFHLSLGLDYPTARHAEAALAADRIDRATRDRVVAADRPGRMPVRDSALGGDIYLHGGGSLPRDWTDGCIAVDDGVIEHLYAIAGPGTAVWVLTSKNSP